MSADNGIYILKTLKVNGGWEYRVRHLQAVENYQWNPLMKRDDGGGPGGYTEDTKWHIFNARGMWADCKVFYDQADAYMEAAKLHDQVGYTEYGISEVFIPECFGSAATITNIGILQLQIAAAFLNGELDSEKHDSWLNELDTRLSNYVTYRLQLRDHRFEQDEKELKEVCGPVVVTK